MAKIQKKDSDIAVISKEMLKSCKSDISKFGFDAKEYEDFLQSVEAMNVQTRTVLKYPNTQIEKYREKYIKKNEYSLGDIYMLEKFKEKYTDENGTSHETGYFCPRSFWDYIIKQKVYE